MYIDAFTKAKVIEYLYETNCITCTCYNYDMRICITYFYMILKYYETICVTCYFIIMYKHCILL